MKVLRDGAKVALTIESQTTETVLLIRGAIRLDGSTGWHRNTRRRLDG